MAATIIATPPTERQQRPGPKVGYALDHDRSHTGHGTGAYIVKQLISLSTIFYWNHNVKPEPKQYLWNPKGGFKC